MLMLNDIYIAINKKHPKYSMGEKSWQNSIRHNLSLHKGHFKNVKCQKGAYWKLKDGAEAEIFRRSKKSGFLRGYKTLLNENVVPDSQIQNQEILNEEFQMKHILEEQADPNSFSYIPPTTQISSIPFQNEDNELVESVLNEHVILDTGKSLSEALLFAEHGENMLCTEIVLNVKINFCTQHVLPMF